MAKRNWAAIAQLQDRYTRIAISLAEDPKLLACYERGFPHLFEEGCDEGALRIPLSAMLEAAGKFIQDFFGVANWLTRRHFQLCFGFQGLPSHAHKVAATTKIVFEEGPVPQPLIDQLVGQKAQAGLLIEVDGITYLVTDIGFTEGDPEVGSIIDKPPTLTQLELVDASFFDLAG